MFNTTVQKVKNDQKSMQDPSLEAILAIFSRSL